MLAKKYYKKHLKMYYTIDSKSDNVQIVIVQFFTESKKDSNNFSICLRRDTSSGCFESEYNIKIVDMLIFKWYSLLFTSSCIFSIY